MQTVLSQEEVKRLKKMMRFENKARKLGFKCIAGIDEAGRGPLAGPVVAAACVLPTGALIEGVDDSKKLLPSERYALFQKILALPRLDYGIGVIDALIIDQVNILQATFMAMMAAVSRLSQAPDYVLVDGNKMPSPTLQGSALVKGDSLSQSIAAASILAKVTRDELMLVFDEKWPEYGFKSHKGYATAEHLLAIQKYGPCEIHRKSFEPIKSLTGNPFFYPKAIPCSVEESLFDKVSAAGLQQAKPICRHMGDANGCKDGDADAVKSEVLNRTRCNEEDL